MEYLVDTGRCMIIVKPYSNKYYLIGTDDASLSLLKDFVEGKSIDYENIAHYEFRFSNDEKWTNYQGAQFQLGVNVTSDELLDNVCQKRMNYGGLVATRENEGNKVKVFKKARLNLT